MINGESQFSFAEIPVREIMTLSLDLRCAWFNILKCDISVHFVFCCWAEDMVDCSTVPFNKTWNKQTLHHDVLDQQMIDHLRKDHTVLEFFYQPPVNKFTLFFHKSKLERAYRNNYFDSMEQGVASPRYHAVIEMVLSLMVFLFISVSSFLVFDGGQVFVVVFAVSLVLQLLVVLGVGLDLLLGCAKRARSQWREEPRDVPWKVYNGIGVLVGMLPVITAYANLSCGLVLEDEGQDRFLCFCIIVSLLNFCNFSMLCSMVKSIVATGVGLVLLILLNVSFCDFSSSITMTTAAAPNTTTVTTGVNTTVLPPPPPVADISSHLFSAESPLRFEIILDVLLVLLLIWFLNREFEISYRLSFHGSAQAESDTQNVQENKERADWLLHNIIPEHVSDIVKRTHKYSKNHKDVGVIFATIINFNEFYDEGFEGGREYLRVLNELVSDYEVLLDEQRFKDVEKIKTISSCFMAASGLNEASRNSNKHPNAHLFALLDFSVELQNVVQRFNENIFNFNFVLNVGYNFGEVTAGVIGTTKLLYDIWGDTVNIASRMYSTGKPDRIQVPESTLVKLEEMFEFEYRGEIFVKGKGDMKTYLYSRKRPDAHWEWDFGFERTLV